MTTTMRHTLIIQEILETWVNQLPVDSQSGASRARKEDIARLSQELTLRLGEMDDRQTGHWLSMLVELYTQARFGKQTAFHQSLPVREAGTNPSIHSSVVP